MRSVKAATANQARRQSGNSSSASSPAATSPGPVPELTMVWLRSLARASTLRPTMATSPGEAKPAPAEPTMANAANTPVCWAAAMPAAPVLALSAAATTRLRGWRAARKNPTVAPKQ